MKFYNLRLFDTLFSPELNLLSSHYFLRYSYPEQGSIVYGVHWSSNLYIGGRSP